MTMTATTELTTREREVLEDIFRFACSHDEIVKGCWAKVCDRLQLKAGHPSAGMVVVNLFSAEEEINAYTNEILTLASTIAQAALTRVPLMAVAHTEHMLSGLYGLDAEQLNGFLRPIFEESGIGDRFQAE